MGDIRINLTNAVTIMLIAFIGVWLINRGLTQAGFDTWRT